MKTILELDTIDYIVRLDEIREIVAEWCLKTKAMDIRKKIPVFTGKESEEEIAEMKIQQIRSNFGEIMRSALREHPAETAALLESVIVYDPGEEKLKGHTLFAKAFPVVMNKDVLSFFTSLMQSGLIM